MCRLWGRAVTINEMKENERSQSGGSSENKRRRRKRSRSRRRDPQQGNSTSEAKGSGEAGASRGEKSDKLKASESNSRRRRRRRVPARGNEKRRTNRNQRGRAPQKSYPSHKMETRDETSAGGLVVSGLAESVQEDGSVDLSRVYVALIGRLDRRGRLLWSMPKGHVEPGEDIAATAEREVWEETGIHGEVFADLGVIDYWFVSEGTRIHKTVHHHLLRYVDGDLNDEDPEVTEVAWIPASALIEHFAYADERKLARIAHDLLPQMAVTEHAAGRMTPR